MKLLNYQEALEVLAKALLRDARSLRSKSHRRKILKPYVYFILKAESSREDAYYVVTIYLDSFRRKGDMITSHEDGVYYVTVKGECSTKQIKGAFWRNGCDTWQLTLPS